MKFRIHFFVEVRVPIDVEGDTEEEAYQKAYDEITRNPPTFTDGIEYCNLLDECCVDPLLENGNVDYDNYHFSLRRRSGGSGGADMNYSWYESPWDTSPQEELYLDLEHRIGEMQNYLLAILNGDTKTQLKALDNLIEGAEYLRDGIKYRSMHA